VDGGSDHCISDIFRYVEICRYQDLRFVSGVIIFISLVIDFKLLGLKESGIACYRLLQGVDGTWTLLTRFYSG
jgi:hypothetical protein